ncbi:GntR family transcriptional regulator [Salmonella enterica]|nr:GntR family transcriptional regulator [Salmonella enterica]
MSVKLSAWVWDGCASNGVGGTKLLVIARLADFSSDEGICWPSIKTIARQIGAGESTVRTAISDLAKTGWLTRQQRRNGNRNASNMYQLNVEKLRKLANSHESESDASKSAASKSGASESDPSDFDPSELSKKTGFDPSESGGDPSVTTDPSIKQISRPETALPDPELSTGEKKPAREKWGTPEDHRCAEWIFSRIKRLYEQAAESDGEITRPKDPNWTAWANEIRLMRTIDGRTHRQICDLFGRVQRDPFWCRNVLSPAKLREKWDDLVIRLGASSQRDVNAVSEPDTTIPEGFRG